MGSCCKVPPPELDCIHLYNLFNFKNMFCNQIYSKEDNKNKNNCFNP